MASDLVKKEKVYSARKRFLERQKLQERLMTKATQREVLIGRLQTRLDVINTYLEDDEVWFEKLEQARLKEIVQAENLYVETLQLLSGQATQIIGVQQQQKLDQLLPVLQQVLQQRGLTVTATERTVDVSVAPPVVDLTPETPACP